MFLAQPKMETLFSGLNVAWIKFAAEIEVHILNRIENKNRAHFYAWILFSTICFCVSRKMTIRKNNTIWPELLVVSIET